MATIANGLLTPRPTAEPEKKPEVVVRIKSEDVEGVPEEIIAGESEHLGGNQPNHGVDSGTNDAHDMGNSKKARIGKRRASTSDEGDAPLLGDIMELQFEHGNSSEQKDIAPEEQVPTGDLKRDAGKDTITQVKDETSTGVPKALEADESSQMKAMFDRLIDSSTCTANGQRIIAHREVGRGHTYIVYMGKDFVLMSGEALGRRAIMAYWNGKVKRDATKLCQEGEKVISEDNYEKLAFVASRPFQTRLRDRPVGYPTTYIGAFCKVARGFIIVLVTRTVLRSKLGKTDADSDINTYYEGLKQTPPWEIEPLQWVDRREKATSKSPKDLAPAVVPKAPGSAGVETSSPATVSDFLNTMIVAQKDALLGQVLMSLLSGAVTAQKGVAPVPVQGAAA